MEVQWPRALDLSLLAQCRHLPCTIYKLQNCEVTSVFNLEFKRALLGYCDGLFYFTLYILISYLQKRMLVFFIILFFSCGSPLPDFIFTNYISYKIIVLCNPTIYLCCWAISNEIHIVIVHIYLINWINKKNVITFPSVIFFYAPRHLWQCKCSKNTKISYMQKSRK